MQFILIKEVGVLWGGKPELVAMVKALCNE